ncbi:hypothetical protein [Nocardia jiangsuensis]|uniref:Uncharacterized protein n=1 Tax=Nocardia jiangsuensis TaxID=1691563 RepID=A0ABV8E243_9NOCA
MEFTHTGWIAHFTGTETMMGRSWEVDGWDAITGTAMVVDAQQGARRPVTDYPDFSHLERTRRVVTSLPGGGWHACERARTSHDPDSPIEPVLAWLVTSRGELTPVTMDAEGEIGADGTMNRFFPPGTEHR